MVGVVVAGREVSGKWFEHITIFYDIFTTSIQMVVVQTIVVELHYYIQTLVSGRGIFTSKMWGYRGRVDVYYAPRKTVAVCFDGQLHIVLEYIKRCCVDLYGPEVCWDVAIMVCLASGWCFVLLKSGVKYVGWSSTFINCHYFIYKII